MNIQDVTEVGEIPKAHEVIPAIFAKQHQLMAKYEPIETQNGIFVPQPPFDIDDRRVQYRIKDMMWRCAEELAESAEDPPQTFTGATLRDGDSKLDHSVEELVDALHFIVEASIYAGMDPQQIGELWGFTQQMPLAQTLDSDWLVAHIGLIVVKMGLACNCLKNKPWKQTEMETDRNMFSGSMLQVWQAFFEMYLAMGFDLRALYILYAKKHAVNQWRQDTNY